MWRKVGRGERLSGERKEGSVEKDENGNEEVVERDRNGVRRMDEETDLGVILTRIFNF